MQNSKERICNYLYKCQSYLSVRKKNCGYCKNLRVRAEDFHSDKHVTNTNTNVYGNEK
jgi:hypothetical protein